MPLYEYQCTACDHTLEALQKLSDAPLTDCPACGQAATLQKLMSAAGFRLKGGGWYETDFKGGSTKNVAKNDAPPTSACESSGGCGSCPAATSD